jgi:uncharacterized membrane protein YkoI
MNKSTIAAWSLAAVVATTGAVSVFAHEHESSKEEKVTYRSSVQVPAGVRKQSELQKLAKITKEDAVRTAQGAAVGTIAEAKLENEEQNLVYTVEIANGNKTTEVIIDAGNGKVLATAADDDEDDEKGDHEGDHQH